MQGSVCIPVMQLYPNPLLNCQTPQGYEYQLKQPIQSIHVIYPIGMSQIPNIECHPNSDNIMNSLPQSGKPKMKSSCKSVNRKKSEDTSGDQSDTQKDPKAPRKKFSPEEDEKLKNLVEKIGSKKWEIIAKEMPGRTGRQCRDRYQNYLIPGFFNGQWSQQEDELLLKKFIEFGSQWSKITPFFSNRSANALKNRWNYFVSRHLNDFSGEKMQNIIVCNNYNNKIDDSSKENENVADIIYENSINYTNQFDFLDLEPINDGNEINYKEEGHDFPNLLIDYF